MLIKQIQGLKFPDEYIIRFFFKEGLDKRKGSVLELGCGNGNNLTLFYQYGWKVSGVDINSGPLRQGKTNFKKIRETNKLSPAAKLLQKDMVDFCASYVGPGFDVLLLPSSIYYLSYPRIKQLFLEIKKQGIVKRGSLIFIRVRTPQDYRRKKGGKAGAMTFRIDFRETGESGCLNTFFTASQLRNLLEANFTFKNQCWLRCDFDNYQKKKMVNNSDIIFWGRIKGSKK